MQRALRRITTAVSLAAVFMLGCAATSWALSPDDVIELTKQGTTDDVIIAKICSDAEAWDLSSDDIKYLQDKGVSDDVVQALIDPQAASEKYGYQLGEGNPDEDQQDQDQPPDEAQLPSTDTTPYVFTPGYYYGPLARAYFYDPFFYPYMYSSGFAFSIGIGWPAFYASYYYPYPYGYYGYPYFACANNSYYYGGGYCGSGYTNYRTYYQGGGHPYGGGTLTWHDWSSSGGDRHMINTGGAVEQRARGGQGFAIRHPGGGQVYHSRSASGLGGLANRETRSGVVNRGSWIRGGQGGYSGRGGYGGGARVVRGGDAGNSRAWGRSRVVYGGGGGQNMRHYVSAPSRGGQGYGNRMSVPSRGSYGAGVQRGNGRSYGTPVRQGSPQVIRGGGGGNRDFSGSMMPSRGFGGGLGRGEGGMRAGQGFGRAGGMPAGQGSGRMGAPQGGGRGR